MLTTATPDNGL